MNAPSLNVALVWSLESPNDVIWTRDSLRRMIDRRLLTERESGAN
jgi:hypothetical protein